jgi:hypothetical protein
MPMLGTTKATPLVFLVNTMKPYRLSRRPSSLILNLHWPGITKAALSVFLGITIKPCRLSRIPSK